VRVYQGNALNTAHTTNLPKIKLFPNPVADNLTITCTENTNAAVEIYSILGQKLHSSILKGTETTMDVSNFQDGVYVVVLISKAGTDTYKFIKK